MTRRLTNESGDVALNLCKKAGHECTHSIIDDSKSMIRLSLMKALYEDGNDAAILLGGTGLSPRDVTIEAVAPLLDKRLDGFGEIFRKLSFDSIGSPALMTRSIAGTMENRPSILSTRFSRCCKSGSRTRAEGTAARSFHS